MPDLLPKIDPNTSNLCQACGLYLNQLPIRETVNKSQVFWVGLSAVLFDNDDYQLPLSPRTRSGALIEKIESPLKSEISFYKTNLVKCLPLKEGKIRYPLRREMEKCYPNFKLELDLLKPSIAFLLGKLVTSFILEQEVVLSKTFNYEKIKVNEISFIPIHHPSFILVYKQKYLNSYIESIRNLCSEIL